MNLADWTTLAAAVAVSAPALLLAVLGLSALTHESLGERATARWTSACVALGLLATLTVAALMLATGERSVSLELGRWITLDPGHFVFHVTFLFDRLSVPFALLAYVLVGTIGAFGLRYMHREDGFHRFFMLYAVFLVGIVTAALAGTIELLFVGWEFVGLSSALLVAYFQGRRGPVDNGQRVWTVYRLADAAFLLAAVALHHVTGGGDFELLVGAANWPGGATALTSGQALLVGSLLLVAVAGKSGLVPFSGWLPRAMEGPTPSSAVFYGALSVHLGMFLLLRVSPLLEAAPALAAAVVALGLVTALLASLASSVRADIKGVLAYASLTQVGIITAEIGLGLRYVALLHILGHASLRALQILRAPTLLHDYHSVENAIGEHLAHRPKTWLKPLPEALRTRIYRLALQGGGLDEFLERRVAGPFLALVGVVDRCDRRWSAWLGGSAARPPVTDDEGDDR